MPRLFKNFDNPQLARKVTVLRVVSSLLGIAWTVLVLSQSVSGEMEAVLSRGVSRSLARTYVRTVYWGEEPVLFVLNLLCLVGIGALFIIGLHILLARLIEKRHGRPFFKRKYPH
jgi:hypothetical protein